LVDDNLDEQCGQEKVADNLDEQVAERSNARRFLYRHKGKKHVTTTVAGGRSGYRWLAATVLPILKATFRWLKVATPVVLV
jgi:hypothetical protein